MTDSTLPSYSAATNTTPQEPTTTTTSTSLPPTTQTHAYADFTLIDLRTQILSNAAVLKPIFNSEKSRSEYELELALSRCSSGQHTAIIVRRNVLQPKKDDWNHGKILMGAAACDSPRLAYEVLLEKTEVVLGKMLKWDHLGGVVEREVPGAMFARGWKERGSWME